MYHLKMQLFCVCVCLCTYFLLFGVFSGVVEGSIFFLVLPFLKIYFSLYPGLSAVYIFFLLYFFFFLKGCTCGIWMFPGQGLKLELQLLAYTPATAASVTYTALLSFRPVLSSRTLCSESVLCPCSSVW